MADTVRRKLRLAGMVQGVGFRYWAMREAAAYDVRGYVRNLNDGSVEVILEGPPAAVERFAETLKQGPPYGRVTRVTETEEEVRGEFTSFDVRF